MKKFMRTRDPAPAPPAPHPQPQPQPRSQHNGYSHAPKTNGYSAAATAAAVSCRVTGGPRSRREPRSTLSKLSTLSSSGECGAGADAGAAWEDEEFPPQRALDKRLAKNVVWLRPHELCARPTFYGAGDVDDEPAELAARWSGRAGEVGCAALGDACAALALTPRLLARVLPAPQPRPRYTGALAFRFWVFGEWREVRVDDRLPSRGGRLVGSSGALAGDFTLPLVEKAYAKLHGGYGALRAVPACRALRDLTGGVVQRLCLRASPPALVLQALHSAAPRATLPVAGAHVVTGLARVRGAGAGPGDGALVRLRSAAAPAPAPAPAPAAPALSPPDRDLLDQRTARGEFWMPLSEMARRFGALVLVHVGPDEWVAEPALQARRPWRAVVARRRWRAGYNAGGPPGAAGPAAASNPQFQVCVPPTGTSSPSSPPKCHVVVSVTQQYAPAAPRRPHAVGFAVYELPPGPPDPPTRLHHLHSLRLLDVTHCTRAREVATFFTLPAGAGLGVGAGVGAGLGVGTGLGVGAGAGRYLVVPHTRRPHTDAVFLLRILTDEHTHVWEVNEDNAILHDISAEFPGEDEGSAAGGEVEARDVVRAWPRWGGWGGRPSAALGRALVALRGGGGGGAVAARDVAGLAALVARWRAAYRAGTGTGAGGGCAGASAYRTRTLLRLGGASCSNKVVEGVVARHGRGTRLHQDDYLLALARIYLAHERYRRLDAKLKVNPLSLEEMILMTIYT